MTADRLIHSGPVMEEAWKLSIFVTEGEEEEVGGGSGGRKGGRE